MSEHMNDYANAIYRLEQYRDQLKPGTIVLTNSGARYTVVEEPAKYTPNWVKVENKNELNMPVMLKITAIAKIKQPPKLPEDTGLYYDDTGRVWLHTSKNAWYVIRALNGVWTIGATRKHVIADSWNDGTNGVPEFCLPMLRMNTVIEPHTGDAE